MNSKNSKTKWLIVFFVTLLLAIAVDQVTKYLAIKYLQGKSAFSLIEGVLEFQFYSNTGIAWSLLEGQIVFILFTGLIFLAAVLFCIIKLPEQKKFHCLYFLCGILTGGALGNMIDRIRLGYVVDFISFTLIDFPIFNVADMFIVVSVFALGFMFLFVYNEDDLSFLSFKQKKYREVK